ncbi:MAG: thiamine diphosphokinase [Lachnospirales bacterium]
MKCVIFLNGEVNDYDFVKNHVTGLGEVHIVACDGGLSHIDHLNLLPDLLIGDFDSVDKEVLDMHKNFKTIRFPTDKNNTDSELALAYAKKKGFEEVIFYGALGGRCDHIIGNVFLLKKANEMGLKLKIVDENQEIFYIDKHIVLEGYKDKVASLLPLGVVKCKESKGLKYPLDGLAFEIGDSLSISNVIKDNKLEISIEKGNCILVINS